MSNTITSITLLWKMSLFEQIFKYIGIISTAIQYVQVHLQA